MLRFGHRKFWFGFVSSFIFGVGLNSASARAASLQDFFHIQNTPAPIGKLRSANGSVTCTQIISALASACSDSSYADQCVSGKCGCINFNACKAVGLTTGNGSGTLELGIDFGNGPAGSPPDCYPFFGAYDGSGKKESGSQEIDFAGTICDPLKGDSGAIEGGWQLFSWDTTAIVNGAGGTEAGTIGVTSGALKITFKGSSF